MQTGVADGVPIGLSLGRRAELLMERWMGLRRRTALVAAAVGIREVETAFSVVRRGRIMEPLRE